VQIGIAFHFNSKVEQILTKNKTIQGVQVNGATVQCDKVVSNQDVQATYEDLLNDKSMPGFYRKREASSSALIFYWGVKGQFPSMQSHNILFTDQYHQEFQNLFQHQKVAEDPTVYIYISAKENPDDAPEGFENWYVMVNAPSNINMPWQTYAQKIKKSVLAKIKRQLNIDLEPLITFEASWNPAIIQQKSLSATGALYGTSSNTPLSAFLRFPNKAPGIEGLYLAGGTVHPGGGIPLCIYSAKLVTDLIDNSSK
jgi:phytoene desaturase